MHLYLDLKCWPVSQLHLFYLTEMSYLPIKKTYSDLSSPISFLPLPSEGFLASIRLSAEIFISIFFCERKKMQQMPDPGVSTHSYQAISL